MSKISIFHKEKSFTPQGNLEIKETSLHIAVQNGRLEEVKVLIESKANLEARNPDGATPLLLAAQLGHFDICTALLTAGAMQSFLDMDPAKHFTPLYYIAEHKVSTRAQMQKKYELIALCLKSKDVDVNAHPSQKLPVIHVLALLGEAATTGLLLRAKAQYQLSSFESKFSSTKEREIRGLLLTQYLQAKQFINLIAKKIISMTARNQGLYAQSSSSRAIKTTPSAVCPPPTSLSQTK